MLLVLEFFEEFFNKVAVFLGEIVVGVQLQNLVVLFDGVLPVGFLGGGVLRGLALSDKRVRQVVGCGLAELRIRRQQGLGEMRCGFFVVAGLVGGGSGVELQLARAWLGLEFVFKNGGGLTEVPAVEFVQTGLRLRGWNERQEDSGGFGQAAAAVAGKQRKRQKNRRHGERPLVALDRLTRVEDPVLGQFHRHDALLENIPRRLGVERNIKAPGGGGDFAQAGLIEL